MVLTGHVRVVRIAPDGRHVIAHYISEDAYPPSPRRPADRLIQRAQLPRSTAWSRFGRTPFGRICRHVSLALPRDQSNPSRAEEVAPSHRDECQGSFPYWMARLVMRAGQRAARARCESREHRYGEHTGPGR
ncbi:hypothetical protein [Mesorhizobium sp. AR07]|uniref:hypothetical protein n=1 Tax=Mesorhizobium sp. AR07 TaxID=2865838 RepID=UPI00215F7737|nr:hypothetical protein [Mesorhizobium sp. AR07]